MTNEERFCNYCKGAIADNPYMLLNRYGVGSGQAYFLGDHEHDGGVWYFNPDDPEDTPNVCGSFYHFPTCLVDAMNLVMVETDIKTGKQDGWNY
jgi:hypothetical protein